jgi:hypothetical protein
MRDNICKFKCLVNDNAKCNHFVEITVLRIGDNLTVLITSFEVFKM